jgi:hypothetical protein
MDIGPLTGDNVVAVEVHRIDYRSDISMDLELIPNPGINADRHAVDANQQSAFTSLILSSSPRWPRTKTAA